MSAGGDRIPREGDGRPGEERRSWTGHSGAAPRYAPIPGFRRQEAIVYQPSRRQIAPDPVDKGVLTPSFPLETLSPWDPEPIHRDFSGKVMLIC